MASSQICKTYKISTHDYYFQPLSDRFIGSFHWTKDGNYSGSLIPGLNLFREVKVTLSTMRKKISRHPGQFPLFGGGGDGGASFK